LGYRFSYWIASFFSSMESMELSRNIRLNQYVVNGEKNTHQELVKLSKDVLCHAGKCYYDFYHYYNNPEKLEDIAPLSDSMKEFIKICNNNQGYLVVAPHLSNFDLVVSRLVKNGFKGRVLSYPNPGSGYQLQNQIRSSYGLVLTPAGDPSIEQELVEYLKSGGIVATGIDRPIPERKKRHYIKFFGRPSPMPVGYVTTALAANVPIIVVTAIMLPNGEYEFMFCDPLELIRHDNKMEELKQNAEMVLKHVEKYIRMAPEQWLMYYPAWPDLLEKDL
jgi:lauroyl/myristoyl acyltransferase